jgi:predicted  nucleic acid-binding Zn-ribbon protein
MNEELKTLGIVGALDRTLRALDRKAQKARDVLAAMEGAHAKAVAALDERIAEHKDLRKAEKAAERKMTLYQQRRQSAVHALENGLGDTDAAQRQIDQCSAILDETETEILGLLENQDTAATQVAGAESALKEAATALSGVQQTVPADLAALHTKASGVRQERNVAFARLEAPTRDRYESLATRKGTAVARIERGCCSACQRVIQPQHIADLKRGRIIPCHGCYRWLVPVD